MASPSPSDSDASSEHVSPTPAPSEADDAENAAAENTAAENAAADPRAEDARAEDARAEGESPGASATGDPFSTATDANGIDDEADGDSARASTLGAVREPQRLHPMTMVLRILASLPAFLFLLLPLLTNPSSENYFSLVMAVAFGIFALPAIILRYLRFSYRITPKQIVIQQGVFNRQNRSIPIERVQNVQIEQNLIARISGIAKVQIETAGSAGTEGTLEYVGLGEAHKLREVVRSIQKEQDETDAPADEEATHEDADTREKLYGMTLGRTLLSGAFRFSLLYIALIFSLFQFFEPDTVINWFVQERGTLEGYANSAANHPALVAVGTILLAILFGWLSGILLHVNRYYGFQLWLQDGKLRKRHGLFTVTEGTIPLSKVQALILKTNPLMRAFGWHELEVQTVGLDVNEQGHRVIVPFAKREEILKLAQRVRPFTMPDAFSQVSRLTIRRRFVRRTVALSVLVGLGVYFWPVDWWHPMGVALPWWAFVLTPLILAGAVLEYVYHRYHVGEDGFYVQSGVLSHSFWILPTEKFHVFYSTASIFQRRLDLKTMYVDTAGASGGAYPEVVDVPEDVADACVQKLDDSFRVLYARRIAAATQPALSLPASRASLAPPVWSLLDRPDATAVRLEKPDE